MQGLCSTSALSLSLYNPPPPLLGQTNQAALLLAVRTALTLTLIKTEYWDRAGGGGNISHEW